MKGLKNIDFYKRNDFWIRLSLSILFISIFLIVFFYCGGTYYFIDTKTVDEFIGDEFQLHVIDVGQADSMLLIFPDDTSMLIDAGSEDEGETVASYVKRILKQEKIDGLDYMLLTHQDADHIGGACTVLNEINVNTIFRPKVYAKIEVELGLNTEDYKVQESQIYNDVIETAINKGCQFIFSERGLTYNFGGCSLEFLSPGEDTYSNSNNYSAVVMATYQSKKILFMGDSEQMIEEDLVDVYGDYLKADILKVAHHGSSSSSSKEFLELVKPQYAIICARANADLPNASVLNNLNDVGAVVLSTALDGSFAFSIENQEIKYSYINTPNVDIALLISITVLLLILTWGIRFKIKKYKPQKIELKEDLNE